MTPPRILLVCTGNVCRSPFAEMLLRAALEDRSVIVSSRGIAALDGVRIPPELRALCERHDVSAGAHRAAQLVESDLETADLVLTATRAQRSHVVQMLPRVVRRAFTMREFGRIVSQVDDPAVLSSRPGGGHLLARSIAGAAALRGMFAPEDPGSDDIIDPYRAVPAVYALMVDQTTRAMDQVAPFLRDVTAAR